MSSALLSAATFQQLPQRHIEFPDVDKHGKPIRDSVRNVAVLLAALRISARMNTFTGTVEVDAGDGFVEISEGALDRIWSAAQLTAMHYRFDAVARLLRVLADGRRHHPVLEYLKALQWDGTPRLDTWLSTHIGAADTALNRAFGRSTLLGGVRRILEPGCKHDLMLVLEGAQGTLKSSAISVLGGPFYGDGLRLGQGAKETIEQTHGRWIIEIPELGGMQNREVEAVKHQISCQVDRARPAYGRTTVSVPRQCIFIGSTNSERYLKDGTGARRFCPVRVGRIDIEALKRDRDQLWAEAYARANAGEASTIPPDQWEAAATEHEARRVVSSIEEGVAALFDGVKCGYISKEALWVALGRQTIASRTQVEMNLLTDAMKKLGWDGVGKKQRPPAGGNPVPIYEKLVPGATPAWLVVCGGKVKTIAERNTYLGF